VQGFQRTKGAATIFVSLRAGGTGITLTAADYVFLLDPWWNPAVEAQAVDRVHRIGQTKPVLVYRLVTRRTIEEKIERLKQEKRELVDDLLAGERNLDFVTGAFDSLRSLLDLDAAI
jgi:SNF2 family DNA or RNA helicase